MRSVAAAAKADFNQLPGSSTVLRSVGSVCVCACVVEVVDHFKMK